VIESVVSQCQTVANEVIERTKVRDSTEIEEGRFGQQVKQKPMNEIRKENEERKYLLERAQKDKEKLRNFVRLVDYIVVEELYHTNFVSMQALLDEMKRTGRK
jgi:dynein heavy chain